MKIKNCKEEKFIEFERALEELQEMVKDKFITKKMYEHVVNEIDWKIDGEDVDCFVVDMANLKGGKKSFLEIVKVQYSFVKKIENLGYDGAYSVSYKDGSKKIFGWKSFQVGKVEEIK